MCIYISIYIYTCIQDLVSAPANYITPSLLAQVCVCVCANIARSFCSHRLAAAAADAGCLMPYALCLMPNARQRGS